MGDGIGVLSGDSFGLWDFREKDKFDVGFWLFKREVGLDALKLGQDVFDLKDTFDVANVFTGRRDIVGLP